MQPEGCPDLSDRQWLKAIQPAIEMAEVIVVDNISTLCRSGNENEAESWRVVQDWAIQQRSAGKTILFIHHSGKAGTQRGTSKREDVMDTVISLKRPEDYSSAEGARFEVHFEKARHFSGEGAESFEVSLQSDEEAHQWVASHLEESNYQKAVGLYNEGKKQVEIAVELNLNKSTISKYIHLAKQRSQINKQEK